MKSLPVAFTVLAFSAAASAQLSLKTLSTDARRVTGGDVLVEISASGPLTAGSVKIMAGDRDVTSEFHEGTKPGTLMGLVTGLPNGTTVLRAEAQTKDAAPATLEITNYPIAGPVLSGPWLQPFICETDKFKLPDGTTLGPPLDANCSANTVVQYVYWPTDESAKAFKALPDPKNLPEDVAMTTTSTGQTARFIVRVETGTMNRGIYQNAVLFDPTVDVPPLPGHRPSPGTSACWPSTASVALPAGTFRARRSASTSSIRHTSAKATPSSTTRSTTRPTAAMPCSPAKPP